MAAAPAEGRGLRPPSWRALGWFWAATAGLAGCLGLLLTLLGPPAPMEQQAAVAPPEAATVPPPTASPPQPLAAGPGASPAPAPAPAPPLAPQEPPAIPAPNAPDQPIPRAEPAMLENGPYGPLPRIAADGRTAMAAYARGFDRAERRPRVGVVLGGLGMNAALTEEAIRRLPPGVTLAFSPYATQVALLLDRARARGMEVLLALPLEPTGYPLNSPGDRALLTTLSPAENADRLDWALSRFTGYVGAVGALGPMRGERYAALSERFNALQDVLRGRGLAYVDPRPGAAGPGRAWGRTVDVVIDDPPNRQGIDRKLAALEQVARERGGALGYAGEATPVLLERLAAWAGSLESRGSVLAPVTALLRRPEATAASR